MLIVPDQSYHELNPCFAPGAERSAPFSCTLPHLIFTINRRGRFSSIPLLKHVETEARSISVTCLPPHCQELAVLGPGLWFPCTQTLSASLCSFPRGPGTAGRHPCSPLPILWPRDLLYPVGDCTAPWNH